MKKAEKQYLLEKLEESAETMGYYSVMEESGIGNKSGYQKDAEIAMNVQNAIERIALDLGITYVEVNEVADRGFNKGKEYAKRDLQFIKP